MRSHGSRLRQEDSEGSPTTWTVGSPSPAGHETAITRLTSIALRHSRALNVGTFHEPSERILTTQIARPLVEIFFGRLDARTTANGQTSELMERFFPGDYELVAPGASLIISDRGMSGETGNGTDFIVLTR